MLTMLRARGYTSITIGRTIVLVQVFVGSFRFHEQRVDSFPIFRGIPGEADHYPVPVRNGIFDTDGTAVGLDDGFRDGEPNWLAR